MAPRQGLELRAASSSDAAGLAELMQPAGLSVDVSALAMRIEAIRAAHGTVLLALEYGPPSGVIAVSWAWALQAEARFGHITLLLVDLEARRRGVGRLLVKAAAQAARAAGCGALAITPPAEAMDLRAFCEAAGFDDVDGTLSRPLRRRR